MVGALSPLVLVLTMEEEDSTQSEVLVIESVLLELAAEDAAVLEIAEVLLTPVGT